MAQYYSDSVLNNLPDVKNDGWQECHLMLYNSGIDGSLDAEEGKSTAPGKPAKPAGDTLWTFLFNPSVLEYSKEAVYAPGDSLGSAVGWQHYVNTTGEKLSIQNAFMQSWQEGKSLQPLIDGLKSLLAARFGEGVFRAPPVLSLVWGTKRFAPCVLTSVRWTEAAWLNGEPAKVQYSLEFVEIRKDQADGQVGVLDAEQPATSAVIPEDGTPPETLTDAQAQEASRYAQAYLENNPELWSPDVQALINSDAYLLQTNRETGDVVMLNSDREEVGIILRSNGIFTEPDGSLRSGGITTVTPSEGSTLAERLEFSALIPPVEDGEES